MPKRAASEDPEGAPPPIKAAAKQKIYSTNPNTVRARARAAALSGVELLIEKRKNADQAQVTAAYKVLKKTPGFDKLSKSEQKEKLKAEREAVMHKLKVDGIHADCLARELGYGKIGGAYATIDDGNSAWEDLDVDWELDHLEQQDDRYNGEKAIGSVPVSSLKAHNRSVESNYQNKLAIIGFRTWQKYWLTNINNLRKKHVALESKNWDYLIDFSIRKSLHQFSKEYNMSIKAILHKMTRFWDEDGNFSDKGRGFMNILLKRTLRNFPTPRNLLTHGEKAVWRNYQAWSEYSEEEWITLPGPAGWWSETAGGELHCEEIFGDEQDVESLYKAAYNMVFSRDVPEDYNLVYPGHDELKLMGFSKEAHLMNMLTMLPIRQKK